MKEQQIVFAALNELETALLNEVVVRTVGGDSDARPPLCLLDWETTRLSGENGHNPFGGILRDSTTGDATGREFHRYYLMELDVAVRADDEATRDTWLSDVVDAFLPFEYEASDFHADTTEWEVGEATPRTNPVVEPDWFEAGVTVRFKYVSRVQQTADALTGVQKGANGGVYVDETLDE